jgi:uncharacterized protein YndB with AHSA1/START domain
MVFPSEVSGPRKSIGKHGKVAAFMHVSPTARNTYSKVTACEPPRRILFTWRTEAGRVKTEVEDRFAAEGNATRVEVEHRGWEVGPKATAAGKSYDGGWDFPAGQVHRRSVSMMKMQRGWGFSRGPE